MSTNATAAVLRPAVSSPEPATAEVESAHYLPQGDEMALFEQAYRNRLPLLLKGPTGCGKTRFVRHMAERLGRRLYTVACHDDLTAADLVGRHLIGDRGTFWSDGPLTRAVREGAICYLDEIVEARKDTTVVLHPLTDDRRILPIERTGETLAAPSEFMLVVSYNPGYQNLLKGLKPSTRQRFVALSLGFPTPVLEARILIDETGIEAILAHRLVALGTRLRALKDHDLDEGASTRLLVYAATLIRAGMTPTEACRAALIEPLTDDPETIEALCEIVDAGLG
jgi:nitric oxide reductase NorQ protein